MNTLLLFFYLQLLDLLTTEVGLLHHTGEGNPIVRMVMILAPTPLVGLIALKVVAVVYGVVCYRTGRGRVLTITNWCFAGVVVWNLAVLIAGGAGR